MKLKEIETDIFDILNTEIPIIRQSQINNFIVNEKHVFFVETHLKRKKLNQRPLS